MKRIMLRLAMLFTTAIVLTTAPVHDTFADEPTPPQVIPDSALAEPSTPAPAQEEQPPPPDTLQPADAGDVQERGVFRQFQLPQGTFPAPSGTTPAPATKIPVPGITAPTPGAALPPDRYQAPTPNLTLIANALRLNHKSLTTLLTLPPNLPVTRPVDIGIIYTSPAGIGQMKQSYAGGTGNRFLYNDREGDGTPRAMDIAITLTEPSAGEAGIYHMKWHANLDPLYTVTIGNFFFKLLTSCDTVGTTEIRVNWLTPDSQKRAFRFSTGITPTEKIYVPQFNWAGSELSWSHQLRAEGYNFVDEDHAITQTLENSWHTLKGLLGSFNVPLGVPHLLELPSQNVAIRLNAENESSCKAKIEYKRAKSLHTYSNLESR